MATRSLTEIYILMRNNASQNRNIYSDLGSCNDRIALVPNGDDVEMGCVPPSWSSIVEDCQYTLVKLKIKLASLTELHSKAISRPTFNDSSQDEVQIQNLSEEITRIYNGLYRSIGQIYNEASHTNSSLEKKLVSSVTRALVAEIQSLHQEFRTMESNYKNKLKNREDRSKAYFDAQLFDEVKYDDDDDSGVDWSGQTSLQIAEERIQEAMSRERDVDVIVSSVIGLRDIYRELQSLVVHQGTVLDRIDYQIETTQCQVKQATTQLEKAARYQRGNKKMVCIVILTVTIILLIFLLIITKIKSREWEKERRDKLNTGFNDLYKLLPDHDPSISLSKMDILRRAAEYIRLLQDQNEEIIKSGDNDVLRNEAERLKKRVAYLLLKTKDLVTALRAAGVPIPNNIKKKKKKSKAHKIANGKDQNHRPSPSGAKIVQEAPCAVEVGSGGKSTVTVVSATPLPGKKVKCGCEKAAKKNPLSELNCTSATTSGHPVPCHVTVVPSVSQSSPTILGAPVQANIQTLAPTLGPGTLIFRDGRVVTVPPASPIIPQILVKPQPTLIVMQRTPIVPLKRDKVPLIAPKRREITQTTFTNKTPIPAIKTFRLESYPRPYKPKGKKKKEAKSVDNSATKTPESESPTSHKSGKQTSVNNSSGSNPVNSKSPSTKKLKRKADPIVCMTKVAKPTSIDFPKLKEKSLPSEGSKQSGSNQNSIQLENPHEIEEKNHSVTINRNDENMEIDSSKSDSIKKGSGALSSTQEPSSVVASNQCTSAKLSIRSTSDSSSVPQTSNKRAPIADCIEVELDIVEKVQLGVENSNTVPEKTFENVNASMPVGLSNFERLDQNSETYLTKFPSKMMIEYSVEDSNPVQSAEKSNVLTNYNTGGVKPSSQISDADEGSVIEDRACEENLQKGSDVSSLPATDHEKESISEKPYQQKISGNAKVAAPPIDRSSAVEDPRKFPSFPNADVHERGNLERTNFSIDGLDQLRSSHQSCSTSSASNLFLSNPKTSAESLHIDAAAVSSSSSCSLAKPSGNLIAITNNPPDTPLNNSVTPTSLSNAAAVPSSGFPSQTAMQCTPLFAHPATSAGLLPNNSVQSIASASSVIALSSCSSSMSVPLFSNSATSTGSLPALASLSVTPACSMPSNSLVHARTLTSKENVHAPHNATLSLYSATSKASSLPVFPKSSINTSLDPKSSSQFRFEDSAHNQPTSSSLSNPSKSAVLTKDINQTAPQKDSTLRNMRLDADLCTAVQNLDSVGKSVNYQNEVSSKLLKDMQCNKTATELGSGSITQDVGASQKLSYSEQLDRTNNSHRLARSMQSNTHTALSTASVPPASLTTSSQVYSFGISMIPAESSRPESFFNYENPIATIPSDPFFSNFKAAEMPVSCTANTGFGYSTFTTQAPPVRSVARQLFPADPICSVSNSYNLDNNIPPLNSSTAGQMFQFSSYSNTNSFRDPLLFTNDFLSTPTKNTTAPENLPQEKDHSINNTHNFPDLLHPTTSMNSLSNVTCSFSVGQVAPTSSAYALSEFRTSTTHSNRKQYQGADQSMINSKHLPKSGSDGNFSMNVITSSSELRIQDTRNPSNADYSKPIETTQNLNFPYLNTSQSLAPQMTLDSFNFNMRDSVQQSQNNPSHALQNNTNSNQPVADKNFQKTSNHRLNPQKPSLSKEFCTNTSVASSPSSRGVCDVQPNLFRNDANSVYQDTSKSTQGTNNFRVCGNNAQSSNRGVQTHQSYLCNPNPQQALNKTLALSSGSLVFTCSSQANQNHSTHYNKKFPKTGQDSLYAVSDNHMKIAGGQTSTESADCSLTVRSNKNYQPASSLSHSSLKTTSSHHVNFSTGAMFSHTHANRPMQGPIIGSCPGASVSSTSQSIYSHPTTASNQGYSHIGDSTRNTHQNLFRLSNVGPSTSAQSNQPLYQSNLCSSSSQIFSTVESLAQQNLDALNQKTQSNPGNQIVNHTQLNSTDVNVFGGMTAPQNHPNQKDSQTDMMSTFSMSNITGYSSQRGVPIESMTKSNQNQTYSQLPSTKQMTNINKTTHQYPPSSSHTALPPAKHCDYPLSSILTGLNDSVLNTSTLPIDGTPESNKATTNASMSEKTSCSDKVIDKQYSTNTEGSSFKTTENSSCNADYHRNKESERNFIPIMEDVRLNSEFSNDLFSSLQVPTGGAHADSISPTAAFLLAFPLVSTSKTSENPHESDPQDNNTSTPTTILQIGNIEPSNSEMFHPLEFGKDLEASEYLGQLPDKCKRKENSIAKQKKLNNSYHSFSYPSMSSDYNVHYDQSWIDQSKSKSGEPRKKNDKQGKCCGNGNNYETCKDKKKKSKISVNWMAAPDVESFQKDHEASSFQANLSFPMDIDALPDLCHNKKTNAYSWSPSKSLLPLDSSLVIPSTLPTLVGDLALGTPTPADTYKRCDNSKKQEKSPEKQNAQKSQSNFLSVSQLVDPKSKKKLPDKCKKTEKKKTVPFQKRKDPTSVSGEPCMYPDGFLPPLGWDKYRYRNNYSAEALIASQDINESVNFNYQQNPNYFMGCDLNQEHHHQSQQYQNFNFSQNQFSSFAAEEYQNASFSINSAQGTASKRGGTVDKRFREDHSRFSSGTASAYQNHPPSLQTYPSTPLPPTSGPPSSHPSNFTSNTTTSVTNFNLSTIFPEINERAGSQGQPGSSQQQQQQQQQIQQHQQQQHQSPQQQHGAQSHPLNNMSSFQNSNPTNTYRTHNL